MSVTLNLIIKFNKNVTNLTFSFTQSDCFSYSTIKLIQSLAYVTIHFQSKF